MKTTLSLIFCLLLISLSGIAQMSELTVSEEIQDDLRHKKCKEQFLNQEYDQVINYYDSIRHQNLYLQFETYKMASKSYLKLAELNAADSINFILKSDEAYNEALKWYGSMQIKDWDSLKIEINDEPEIFLPVDEQPQPKGGMSAFYAYISQELKYPEEARRYDIEGRVVVHFIVNKDGSLDAVNVVEGIGGGCDEEAARVIQNAENWIPGKQNGEPVYVRMFFPLTFKLTEPTKKKKKRS